MRKLTPLAVALLVLAPQLTALPLDGVRQLDPPAPMSSATAPPDATDPAPGMTQPSVRTPPPTSRDETSTAAAPDRPDSPGDAAVWAFLGWTADAILAVLGWQGLIYLGSFCAAVLVMLFCWWRVACAIAVENQAKIPEWERF